MGGQITLTAIGLHGGLAVGEDLFFATTFSPATHRRVGVLQLPGAEEPVLHKLTAPA